MIRKRFGRGLISLAALSLVLTACAQAPAPSSSTPSADKKPIVLGATLLQTPNYIDWWKQGIEFGIEELNAKGGINGTPVRVQVESFTQPPEAIAAIQKLMSVDKVPYVIGTSTAGFLAQAPEVKGKNVVLTNIAASAPGIAEVSGGNIFSIIPLGTTQFDAAGKAAYKMGYRNVAVFAERSDMGSGGLAVFRKAFEGLGGKIAVSVEFQQNDADFRSQILKAMQAKPDAAFVVSAAQDLGQIIKQSNQLGFKGPWFAYQVAVQQPVIDINGKAADGVVWAATPYDAELGAPKMVAWAKRYEKKYGYQPNIFPAAAYDAVMVAAEAITKAGSTEPAAIAKAMQEMTYEGVSGKIKFNDIGIVDQPMRLMIIKDGKMVNCTTCPAID